MKETKHTHLDNGIAVIHSRERVQQEDGETRAYEVPTCLAQNVSEAKLVLNTQYSTQRQIHQNKTTSHLKLKSPATLKFEKASFFDWLHR